MKRLCLLLAGVAVLASCGGEDGPTDPFASQFDVTVGAGLKPTYTWPGGSARAIGVVRMADTTKLVWQIATATSIGIPSPATHGSTRAAITVGPEFTLAPGVAYRVTVTRQDNTSGWKTFTAPAQ